MTKEKLKKLSDLFPLFILTTYAIILVWTAVKSESGFLWQHIVGLVILPIVYCLFGWQHKAGVIALGLTLLMGLFGLLSYTQTVATTEYWIGIGNTKIPIFYGQPIFVLWLIIHLILSGRIYAGIMSKKYWLELLKSPSKTQGL